jgi:uncharacterized protein (TIGR02453 family)
MQYFESSFISFMKSLLANNNSTWFHANKKAYELDVKKPFEIFVNDLIESFRKYDKGINMTAKEAIFRINRDTRFSKDKSPYKTSMSAAISEGGKDPRYPGLYIELNHEGITLIGGAYTVEKENLHKLRKTIASDLKGFQKLVTDKKFISLFGKIEGEKHKLLSEEFKTLTTKEPLIANKQFYFSAKLPAKLITDAKLLKTVEEYYLAARPLNQFLTKGLF